jgi:predicted phosphodiesterase
LKIGFVGDIHGRVFHTLAVLTRWQQAKNNKLDLIIQVGDLGAYPDPDEDMKNNKFIKQDPTELDFSRLLKAKNPLFDNLHYIRKQLLSSIYLIRGNHEDFYWLNKLQLENENGTICVDPLNLFHYVIDGTVMDKVTSVFISGACV